MITIAMHNALKKNPSTVRGMDKIRVSFKEGITVEDIISKFELQEVGMVIVNGRIARLEYIIQDEDIIEFHPMFGGG